MDLTTLLQLEAPVREYTYTLGGKTISEAEATELLGDADTLWRIKQNLMLMGSPSSASYTFPNGQTIVIKMTSRL